MTTTNDVGLRLGNGRMVIHSKDLSGQYIGSVVINYDEENNKCHYIATHNGKTIERASSSGPFVDKLLIKHLVTFIEGCSDETI